MKNFANVMDREGSGFAFLREFLMISMKKLKAEIFDGHQIRERMKNPIFEKSLSEAKPSTWKPPGCGIREGN